MNRYTKIGVSITSEILLIVLLIMVLSMDRITNGMLYGYGLIYSYEWFYPFKIVSTIAYILLVTLAFLVPLTVMSELDEQ
jgi:hypothetical protein